MGILASINQWGCFDNPPPPLADLEWQWVDGVHPFPACLETDITTLIPGWILVAQYYPTTINMRKYPRRYTILISREGLGSTIYKRCYHHIFERDWDTIIIELKHHLLHKTDIGKEDTTP